MKVFVSSPCYDLLDLRAELYEEFRGLGVQAHFSDIKESAFQTTGEPGVDSIETCLANLRTCDDVVIVLSQRYGPVLRGPYGERSATRVEYDEARARNTRIHFYMRDRLAGEWSSWRRNHRPAGFRTDWVRPDDAAQLFAFIEDHKRLAGGTNDDPARNNWFWTFTTSVDLRADLRRRFAGQAHRATAERMADQGQVPILVVAGLGLEALGSPHENQYRFSFSILNAGTAPAIGVMPVLDIGGHRLPGGCVAVILPGHASSQKAVVETPLGLGPDWIREVPKNGPAVECVLTLLFTTPAGYCFADRSELKLIRSRAKISYRIIAFGAGEFHSSIRRESHGV